MVLPIRSSRSDWVPSSNGSMRNTAILNVFVGTAYLATAEHIEPGSVTLIFDVPGELDAIHVDPVASGRTYKVPVGRGETLQTIFAHASPEVQAAAKDLPVVISHDGMVTIREAGGAAMKEKMHSPELERLLCNRIIPQLAELNGGSFPNVQVRLFAGLSGGTAGKGALVVKDAIARKMLRYTHAILDFRVCLLGAQTFLSADLERTRENAACSLLEWADRARNPLSPRIQCTLHLCELHPVGIDKLWRDSLVIDSIQALSAPELVRERRFIAVNRTVDGPFGNVQQQRTSHYQGLPAELVTADVCDVWRPKVEELLTVRPDLNRVELDWHTNDMPRARESVKGILERALDAEIDEVVESATLPSKEFTAIPIAVVDGKLEYRLDTIAASFSEPLTSIDATRSRLVLLRTCRLRVSRELKDVTRECERLQSELDHACQLMVAALLQFAGASWLGLLRSQETKVERAAAAINEVHRLCDEFFFCTAKRQALESAAEELAAELKRLIGQLQVLVALLHANLPNVDDARRLPLVIGVSIDEIWSRLLGIAEIAEAKIKNSHKTIGDSPEVAESTEQVGTVPISELVLPECLSLLKKLAMQAVRYVTPAGLAEIVGAGDHRLDAIVRAANSRQSLLPGPEWGGYERDDRGSEWIIYPPVERRVRDQLREIHVATREPIQIGFARTARDSINITLLEFRYCKQLEDAFVPFYQQGLVAALQSDMPVLFLSDRSSMERLGVVVDDQGFHFKKQARPARNNVSSNKD